MGYKALCSGFSPEGPSDFLICSSAMARTKYLFSPAKAGSPGLFLSICVIVERRISIKLGYDFKNILSKMQNYALREN
jgi:hypothetical protein